MKNKNYNTPKPKEYVKVIYQPNKTSVQGQMPTISQLQPPPIPKK